MDNEDHIKRLLNEGGQEVSDPRVQPPEPSIEQTAQDPVQEIITPETDTTSDDSPVKVSKSKKQI